MRLLAAILFTASTVAGQPFTKAEPRGGDVLGPGSFVLRDGDRTCVIDNGGGGTCTRPGRRPWPFRVPADDGDIVKLHFIPIGDDLLLGYELEDGDGAWSRLVRVNRGARRPAWSFFIRSFNLAAPVLHEETVIVAALTFLARVSIHHGSHEWLLDHGYAGGGYEAPEIIMSPAQVRIRSHDVSSGKWKDACYAMQTGVCEPCPD
jgi:hypothetical protein